jgi:hypothetical protein
MTALAVCFQSVGHRRFATLMTLLPEAFLRFETPAQAAASFSMQAYLKIRVVEEMAADAMRLARIDTGSCLATERVNTASDGFQMIGVAAGTVAANVVDHETFGNGADKSFVDEAVDEALSAVTSEPAIPTRPPPLPLPASGWPDDKAV